MHSKEKSANSDLGRCIPSGSIFAPTWHILEVPGMSQAQQLTASVIHDNTVVQVGLFLKCLKFCENKTSLFQFNKDLLSMAEWQSIQMPNTVKQGLQKVPASLIPNAFAAWYHEKLVQGQIIFPQKDTGQTKKKKKMIYRKPSLLLKVTGNRYLISLGRGFSCEQCAASMLTLDSMNPSCYCNIGNVNTHLSIPI